MWDFETWRGFLAPALLGDPSGTRTHNPLIKSQLLCRLSYRVATLTLPHAGNAILSTTLHALQTH